MICNSEINALTKGIHSCYSAIKAIVHVYILTYLFLHFTKTLTIILVHVGTGIVNTTTYQQIFKCIFLEYYTALIKYQQHAQSFWYLLHNNQHEHI